MSAIERVVTKGIDFATLDRLAAVLDISPGLLIGTNPNGAWTMHDRFQEHNAMLHQVYRALEALLAATGIEMQAALRLRRRDVDLERRQLHARGNRQRLPTILPGR